MPKDDILTPLNISVQLNDRQELSMRLLELIDQYIKLEKRIASSMGNAIIQLKRGNYLSLCSNTKFDTEYWKSRPQLASLNVDVDSGKVQIVKKLNMDQSDDAKHEESTIRQRKRHQNKESNEETTEIDNKLKPYDPLTTFCGGMVPSVMKDTQKSMVQALKDSCRAINLRNEIEEVIEKISKLDNSK